MTLNWKSGSARLYLYLGAIALAAFAWRAGETINASLSTLIVKAAPHVARNAVPIDAKSFYPVWVKQSVALPIAQFDGEVDTYFRKHEEEKHEPPKPPEPDYGEMFKAAASVDGVADDGVFVNGKFYKIGATLDELAIATATGKTIIPEVERIANGRVVFRVGKATVTFRFAEGRR